MRGQPVFSFERQYMHSVRPEFVEGILETSQAATDRFDRLNANGLLRLRLVLDSVKVRVNP
jgi:hypothetical protein